MDILERFLTYVKIGTKSCEDASAQPTSIDEFDLARLLEQQLRDMGAQDVRLSEYCYVYARIPSNLDPSSPDAAATPKLGFIAHMDTSPDAPGDHVNPRVIHAYEGGDIALGENAVLSPRTFPSLLKAVGDDLVVTDGTTLLGADDKAGIAEIMTLAEYLLSHPEVKHGEIEIAFTPDEEVGRGTEHFDIKGFGATVAYTVDGGALGNLEYENFNAASGRVHIHGVSVHPGSGKGKMINASLVGMEFNDLLPGCRPDNTEGSEGFFHLCQMSGDAADCELKYIIRDHDKEKFEEKKRIFREAGELLNARFKDTDASVEVTIHDQYYNMKEKIAPYPFLIRAAEKATRTVGAVPEAVPIRGGTDGAVLSYRGLPCPNLPTGGENYHGVYEYLNVTSMRKIASMLVEIAKEMVGANRGDTGKAEES